MIDQRMSQGLGLFNIMAIGGALFLGACATPVTERVKVDNVVLELEKRKQRELAVRDYMRDVQRLTNVSYPIFVAAVPFCGEKIRTSIGVTLSSSYHAGAFHEDKEFREAYLSVMKLTDVAEFIGVAAGSPAAKSGIKQGDIPISVDGWSVPVGRDAVSKILDKLKQDTGEKIQPIEITVRRAGKDLSFSVVPDRICDYGLRVQKSEVLNATADGKAIFITQRMMEFARTDDDLAVVVGHELAHNYMKHIEAKQQNMRGAGFAGLLVDILFAAGGVNTQGGFTKRAMNIGAMAFSQEFEAEADYAGSYATALAGYDVKAAPNFWRRMASRNTIAIDFASSHPTTAWRSAALEKIVEEIRVKRRRDWS